MADTNAAGRAVKARRIAIRAPLVVTRQQIQDGRRTEHQSAANKDHQRQTGHVGRPQERKRTP